MYIIQNQYQRNILLDLTKSTTRIKICNGICTCYLTCYSHDMNLNSNIVLKAPTLLDERYPAPMGSINSFMKAQKEKILKRVRGKASLVIRRAETDPRLNFLE